MWRVGVYTPLSITINIGLVGGSIILFFAPFVLLFFLKHRQEITAKQPGFNQFMDRFFDSPYLNWLVLLWAAGEAVMWFVIPEFLLLLIIFMKVRHRVNLLVYDIIGTIIGSIIGLSIHFSHSLMLSLPYVYEGMFTRVHGWFQSMGVWGLVNQPFSGVPYKVFLNMAPQFGLNLLWFLLLALVLRIGRYAVFYGIFWLAYPALHRFVYKNYTVLFFGAIVIFSLLLMKVSVLYS